MPTAPQRIYTRQSIEPKPTYERWQWGGSVGGPIIKDRAQFFATYEENRQDRDNLVTAIEGVNIFSFDNFANIDGEIPTLPSVNPNFGRGRRLTDPGRRLQFGVRYAF